MPRCTTALFVAQVYFANHGDCDSNCRMEINLLTAVEHEITTAICPSCFTLQISRRYLHLLFNSPKNRENRGRAPPFVSLRFAAASLVRIPERTVAFLFLLLFPVSRRCRCHPSGVTSVSVSSLSYVPLANALNATGTFWCSLFVTLRRRYEPPPPPPATDS